MAVFEYTAENASGRTIQGTYEGAVNSQEVQDELAKLDLVPVNIRRKNHKLLSIQRGIKTSDRISFIHEFACLHNAGVPITRSLELVTTQTHNPAIRTAIQDVLGKVQTGTSLASAFRDHEAIFSDFFVNMVEAGEISGNLGPTLKKVADQMEHMAEYEVRVKSAFIYPAIVGSLCILIIACLLLFVIPVFENLYIQMGVQLPTLTMILVSISNFIHSNWIALLSSCLAMFILFRYVHIMVFLRKYIDQVRYHLPVIGRLYQMMTSVRFARSMNTMLTSGVPIADALNYTAQTIGNIKWKQSITEMRDNIASGQGVAYSMSKCTLFPSILVELSAMGEEGGILPQMLEKAADFIETRTDRKIKTLIGQIEPILTVFLGLIIGGILIAIYLPMIDYMRYL